MSDDKARAAEIDYIKGLRAEIERLRSENKGWRIRAEKAEADKAVLLAALEMIAGKRQCLDNLMSDKDIARAAIAKVSK